MPFNMEKNVQMDVYSKYMTIAPISDEILNF